VYREYSLVQTEMGDNKAQICPVLQLQHLKGQLGGAGQSGDSGQVHVLRFVLETVEHEKDTAVVCVGQDSLLI